MATDRLIAWDAELRRVHARLREALSLARAAVDGGAGQGGADAGGADAGGADAGGADAGGADAGGADAGAADAGADAVARDLLLYCTGFCVAQDEHHRSEDGGLFPALVAEYPELEPTVDKLMQDHSMLNYLLVQFRRALEGGADRDALERHLEGIAAIMESHFRFEERELLEPLALLRTAAPRSELLGPLA